MAAIDLSTTYLGLALGNPFVAGASPLGDHLDTVRRFEDAGCAAIVLHSLFEEQISLKDTGRIHHLDPLNPGRSTVVSYFPEPDAYTLGPDAYLEHVRQIKAAVRIPVIGSLNGTTPEAWMKFAALIQEQAPSPPTEHDSVVSDLHASAIAIERTLRDVVTFSSDR